MAAFRARAASSEATMEHAEEWHHSEYSGSPFREMRLPDFRIPGRDLPCCAKPARVSSKRAGTNARRWRLRLDLRRNSESTLDERNWTSPAALRVPDANRRARHLQAARTPKAQSQDPVGQSRCPKTTNHRRCQSRHSGVWIPITLSATFERKKLYLAARRMALRSLLNKQGE